MREEVKWLYIIALKFKQPLEFFLSQGNCDVVGKYHSIDIDDDPAKLFDLSIGALGDLAATINGEDFFKHGQLRELRATLKFAARFFDAYRNSRLGISLDPFTAICASACFYLCDMPGSSQFNL